MTFPGGGARDQFLANKLNTSTEFARLLMCSDMYNVSQEVAPGVVTSGDSGDNNFCSESFQPLGDSYKKVHGYIALVICSFGIFANIMNLIVLTRKEMATPINRMLTALAFADMLVMVEYIPFALHMYIMKGDTLEEHYSWSWALFVFFHMHFTQILHTISIQLTLTMAIWRFVALKSSTRSQAFCTFQRCNYCIIAAYLCPIILCIPNYMTFAIISTSQCFYKEGKKPDLTQIMSCFIKDTCSDLAKFVDLHIVQLSELAKRHNDLLQRIHFWTFSVVIKLIPCLLLTFFMGWLVNFLGKQKCLLEHMEYHTGLEDLQGSSLTCYKTLYKARKHHQRLEKGAQERKQQLEVTGALPLIEMSSSSRRRDDGNAGNFTSNGETRLKPPKILNGNERADEEEEEVGKLLKNEPNCQEGVSVSGNGDTRRESRLLTPLASLRNHRQNSKLQRGGSGGKSKRTDRTSRMLIAVLLLFLLTEFPQGIMALLSGIYGQTFFKNCYNTWAEVWDMLALLNSSINFLLYCFMSKQFRTQFRLIFKLNKSRLLLGLACTQETNVSANNV